jgi:predicted transcriptional regulator
MPVTDTLAASKAYQKAGFSDPQSEALAAQHEIMAQQLVEHIGRALDLRFAHLESRFAQVETRFAQIETRFAQVEARFAQLEAKIEAKIESVARDQLFKVIVVVLSGAGLTVALLSFLFAFFSR